MKRMKSAMLGVTLLEIMLVLAVAAMIIVMSVRYYQSANASQQANSVLQQVQAITAAADSLGQAAGDYKEATTAHIEPLLSNVGGLKTPWGGTIKIDGGTTTGYKVTIGSTPANICGLIWGRLQGDKHFTNISQCSTTGTTELAYTYVVNP